uniref:Uncharacterized protein n=1 Tax=Anguilla anguilla TaxID=7936 RepID=A0A0E9RJT6_ANGAN
MLLRQILYTGVLLKIIVLFELATRPASRIQVLGH